MKLITYQDIHIGAPNAVMSYAKLHELTIADIQAGHTVVWNGDIFDLANCKKEDVEMLKQWAKDWRHEANLFENFYYNTGNHERLDTRFDHTIVEHDGLKYFITHSDKQANEKKYAKYRNKKHGAGWLKRKLWVPMLDWVENWKRVPSEKMLHRCAHEAWNHGCDVFIGGHIHMDYCAGGLDAVVKFLDKGRSEL